MTTRHLLLATLSTCLLGIFGCDNPFTVSDQTHETQIKVDRVLPAWLQPRIVATPALFPALSPSVSDYVIRCSNGRIDLAIEAPQGTEVTIADNAPGSGNFSASVVRSVGQSFAIKVTRSGYTSQLYYVRCLPSDFQEWSVEKAGETQAEWYQVTAPYLQVKQYSAIFDNNGVPVWWEKSGKHLHYFQLLQENTLVYGDSGSFFKSRFDGEILPLMNGLPPQLDPHDLLLLPNGNYLVAENTIVNNVNLAAAWGEDYPDNASILNKVLKEIDASGKTVWQWDMSKHISVEETALSYRPGSKDRDGYDVYHWNSMERTNEGFIISVRNLNAIYHVEKETGKILWKLGGSPRPESLTVLHDPLFADGKGFGGQHDARLLPDGTVSIHDNGSEFDRPPRVVRYQIDVAVQTATLVESISDARVTRSPFRGSARKLSGGNWVIGFGGTSMVAEINQEGSKVFTLNLTGAELYRAVPLEHGLLNRTTLRLAMDAQYAQ